MISTMNDIYFLYSVFKMYSTVKKCLQSRRLNFLYFYHLAELLKYKINNLTRVPHKHFQHNLEHMVFMRNYDFDMKKTIIGRKFCGEEEPTGLLEDLLWSDPSNNCNGFMKNQDRGCSFVFGSEVVEKLCTQLNIVMIIRGHQVVEQGYEFSSNRKVLTLFSAPGYQDYYMNKGAVMKISANRTITFKQFSWPKMMSRSLDLVHQTD
uniref:protein-serine/threonine phosphatase n=1 Tax=Heterorhabditis bacteriophora TaxID=37862 RepID=A0A1I7X7D8_HETBA